MENFFGEFESKMRSAGAKDAAVAAFKHNYECLIAGAGGVIPESAIEPVRELPHLKDISKQGVVKPELLGQAAIIKLNGGLGTSMGLDRAKSLLRVKNDWTFLDLIARQILFLRRQHRIPLRFLLMNSFSTSKDTLSLLKNYPELGEPESLELMQGQVPKVDAKTLRPVVWAANPQLEWCPPGHGDIYPSLLGSGWLDRLLAEGVKYLFVSNSDNLGASLDLNLLRYFAESRNDFLMEVALRTNSDRKGGHLAKRGETLLLRESAQCSEADQSYFQDIDKHQFFNTNNLWIRLNSLKKLIERHNGFVPLPLIKNSKTVDPRDKTSTSVFQLETAMGAAIEAFQHAGAVIVPRSRFAPVKTTSDLLGLRSDAYELTEDWRIVLAECQVTQPPTIDLDPEQYKLIRQLDRALARGVPSLRSCHELVVRGPVLFDSQNVFRGRVHITNRTSEPRLLKPGDYEDCELEM
jgi:UDP-N-acetylglucosamine pyrophosphorylase